MTTVTDIRPVKIDTSEEAVADMRRRVAGARQPTPELVADRSQGVQLATIQELARYWATDYDWRACEAKLNALPQFKTEIDGVDVHFIHVKSPHPGALPLIMTHGWPGSVIELLDVIGPLTDPPAHGGNAGDAFDLVLPSLPGYGYSSQPTEIGWDAGPHRERLDGADAPPRLRPLGGPGRRRRRQRHRRDGPPGTRRPARHSRQPAPERAAWASARGRRTPRANARRSTRSTRSAPPATATSSSRPPGRRRSATPCWTRPSRLAAWMLDHDTDSYEKISRAFVDGQPTGNLTRDQNRRQHQPLLADRHRGIGGPGVLGQRTSPGRRRRPAPAGGIGPGRLHHVPRRDLRGPAQLGRAGVSHPRLLQRGRQGRPLRRLGRARAVRNRDPGRIPAASVDHLAERALDASVPGES